MYNYFKKDIILVRPEGEAMASPTTVGLDETLDMLTHPYRRYVLYHLRTHSEVVDIDTLVAMLASELDGPVATGGRETPALIEIALHHTHLPKLAHAGLIRFDEESRSIECTGMNGHGQFIDQAARIDGYAPLARGD